MYVQLGKTINDVTFRWGLRPILRPRLRKTMERNHIRWNTLYRKNRKSENS